MNVLHLEGERVVHRAVYRSCHHPGGNTLIITFGFHQDRSHLDAAVMCGSMHKRKPELVEREKAVFAEIAAIESSCTARLNYTLRLQTLLAEKERRKKV